MKKTYSSPKLTVHGAVESLTLGFGLGDEFLITSKDLF